MAQDQVVHMTQNQANEITTELEALGIVCEFAEELNPQSLPYECVEWYTPLDEKLEKDDPWEMCVNGKYYFRSGEITIENGRYFVRAWGDGTWDFDSATDAAAKVKEWLDELEKGAS